jgi:hypothetical protein
MARRLARGGASVAALTNAMHALALAGDGVTTVDSLAKLVGGWVAALSWLMTWRNDHRKRQSPHRCRSRLAMSWSTATRSTRIRSGAV